MKYKKIKWTIWILNLLLFFITAPLGFLFGMLAGGFMVGFEKSIDIFLEINNIWQKKAKINDTSSSSY